ncbi:MAG: metalloregulator ArsR/SmtB family transcription factor [Synergistaceae bacterium]|jgi:DNA-binding transcriptional ArsR family regulator|nr:metalloregulator ArsR/SmtB family transcription factor [Synergistaceae bacterium]
MKEKAKQIATLLKTLANENRLMIFCALMERPMTVSALSERLPNITQPALSQHLAQLRVHRILEDTKMGQNVTYSIADHRVEEIIHVLKKYYCEPSITGSST